MSFLVLLRGWLDHSVHGSGYIFLCRHRAILPHPSVCCFPTFLKAISVSFFCQGLQAHQQYPNCRCPWYIESIRIHLRNICWCWLGYHKSVRYHSIWATQITWYFFVLGSKILPRWRPSLFAGWDFQPLPIFQLLVYFTLFSNLLSPTNCCPSCLVICFQSLTYWLP